MTPEWICTGCGTRFSRRWNLKRHIDNMHLGVASALSAGEYVGSIEAGKHADFAEGDKTRKQKVYDYRPSSKQIYKYTKEHIARRLAERIGNAMIDAFDKIPNNKPVLKTYLQMTTLVNLDEGLQGMKADHDKNQVTFQLISQQALAELTEWVNEEQAMKNSNDAMLKAVEQQLDEQRRKIEDALKSRSSSATDTTAH